MKRALYQVLAFPVRLVIIAVSLIEAALRPIYRPIVAVVSKWRIFAWLEHRIASLPRLAILVLLAVPFAIAEPAKVLAIVIIARGHLLIGVVTLVVAYLATFLIVERIYHAGRHKLLTYRWLAWIMHYAVIARRFYERIRDAARLWLQGMKARLFS